MKLTRIVRAGFIRELAVFDYTKVLDRGYLIIVARGENIYDFVYTYSISRHLRKRITRKTIGLIFETWNITLLDIKDMGQNVWKEKDIKTLWYKISTSFMSLNLGSLCSPGNAYIID